MFQVERELGEAKFLLQESQIDKLSRKNLVSTIILPGQDSVEVQMGYKTPASQTNDDLQQTLIILKA
jgi:hypothetical protein